MRSRNPIYYNRDFLRRYRRFKKCYIVVENSSEKYKYEFFFRPKFHLTSYHIGQYNKYMLRINNTGNNWPEVDLPYPTRSRQRLSYTPSGQQETGQQEGRGEHREERGGVTHRFPSLSSSQHFVQDKSMTFLKGHTTPKCSTLCYPHNCLSPPGLEQLLESTRSWTTS